MILKKTFFGQVKLIQPKKFEDTRGFLYESLNKDLESIIERPLSSFCHEYFSHSKKNVIRGLHYQFEQPQGKLIRCINGKIFDVFVDLREDSETFGKYDSVILDSSNQDMIWIPEGFAHGFQCLSDDALCCYMCTDEYSPASERCIKYDDPVLNIDWPSLEAPILSDKDLEGKTFESIEKFKDKNNSDFKKDRKVLYAEANYGQEEIQAATNVLRRQKHNLVTSHNVEEFEHKVANIFGKKYGLMSNSGSSANLLAIKSFNFPSGGEVITPTLTFSTTVAPIVQSNLVPVFVDSDIETLQANTKQIADNINDNTVAIMIPNLIGNIPDWEEIYNVAKDKNVALIEDSADTIGYKFNGKDGNVFSNVVTTSFYASHIITGAGVGGMTCFDDEETYLKAKSLRSWGRRSSQYGETEDINRRLAASIDDFDYDDKYIFDDIGYNFIPSELSAAFALEQFKKLDKNIQIRKKNFKHLKDNLKKFSSDILTFKEFSKVESNWLAFPLCLQGKLEGKRRELQLYLENKNIQTRTIFTGNITKHPIMNNINYKKGVSEFPNADRIMKNGILLGCHNSLEEIDLDYMTYHIENFITQLS